MSTVQNTILIVEDDPAMRRFLRASLSSCGYYLFEASSVSDATMLASSQNPDLILLDLGLPDGNGIEFTRSLRQWSRIPVVVISARGREDDKVAALDAGADDYLTKPFGINELFARIRVALRHASPAEQLHKNQVIDCGDLYINQERHYVARKGTEVHLTPTEFKLLVLLAQNAGRVLTHRQILTTLWGPHHAHHNHYVRVHMAELRKKIEADPARPQFILTEPGVGYRFTDRF